ncbi:arginase family protein [Myxococcota bacterium]|nr:arginase family protein [Myxococcota bacterium]
MDAITQLERMLRPAAGGIYTVSTGTKDQLRLQRSIYGATSDDDVRVRWRRALEHIRDAKVVLLGVPSDVGAGFVRGSSFGPQTIRRALIERGSWLYQDPRVVDAGDVLVVPQLLHDDMLSAEQLAATRAALHGDDASTHAWPVSPLSVAEAALKLIRALAPSAVPIVLGGDHSIGWPVTAAIAEGRAHELGILHFDAHTDLLEHRLGVRYCFATWAYHANELIGRGRRLHQVGLRISRHSREHWERTLDVRQYWMAEMNARSASDVAAEIIDTMRAAGVRGVYVSNDIDGTDPAFGAATGTPEPGGLHPDTVVTLIREVTSVFPMWGSDLVEVAPPVAGEISGEPSITLATSVRYLEVQARAALGETS